MTSDSASNPWLKKVEAQKLIKSPIFRDWTRKYVDIAGEAIESNGEYSIDYENPSIQNSILQLLMDIDIIALAYTVIDIDSAFQEELSENTEQDEYTYKLHVLATKHLDYICSSIAMHEKTNEKISDDDLPRIFLNNFLSEDLIKACFISLARVFAKAKAEERLSLDPLFVDWLNNNLNVVRYIIEVSDDTAIENYTHTDPPFLTENTEDFLEGITNILLASGFFDLAIEKYHLLNSEDNIMVKRKFCKDYVRHCFISIVEGDIIHNTHTPPDNAFIVFINCLTDHEEQNEFYKKLTQEKGKGDQGPHSIITSTSANMQRTSQPGANRVH